MPVTVVAPADRTSGEDLRALVESYVKQYPAGGGDRLRLTAGDGDPQLLFGAVAGLLGELGWDPELAPDIEIMPGQPLDVARPGHLVLAAGDEVRTVGAAGSLPLETAWLPGPPASAVDALRRLIGYAGLLWIAETRRASGYAAEARMFVQALDEAGLEPALAWPEPTRDEIALSFASERLLRRSEQRRPEPSGTLAVWHRQPMPAQSFTAFAASACRTMWETDTLPAEWPGLLNGYERVWVPTAFNLEGFVNAGVDERRLRILPGTVDFDLYRPSGPRRVVPERRGFAFLSTFDFQERKGWRPLLEAYAREFDADDDVTLVLKIETIFADTATVSTRIDAFLADLRIPARRLPHVVLLHERLSDAEMPALFRACDAYVSPTRGEGWGRPLMEALACGRPVITSRWSGQLAFLDDTNAWLVDGGLVPVPNDVDIPVFRGGRWFDPDVDALRAAMRAVAGAPEAAAQKALAAREPLCDRFSRAAVAERIAELVLDAL
ncbi:MAG TPA: glycosyltransferase [Solirubrobacteraceae bacterium]